MRPASTTTSTTLSKRRLALIGRGRAEGSTSSAASDTSWGSRSGWPSASQQTGTADWPSQPGTLGLGAAYLGRVRSQAAATAKQPHVVLLGLLVAAIALGGTLTVAHSVWDWCAHHHCPVGNVALTTGSGESPQQPTGEPCRQAQACGGAAHTLGTSLAIGVVAVAGVALLGPDGPSRILRPVTDRLHSPPLLSGLDHPPRLAS